MTGSFNDECTVRTEDLILLYNMVKEIEQLLNPQLLKAKDNIHEALKEQNCIADW